jgi:hypothetical protein
MVADKVYHFICDPDSPVEHIKEALFQCQKYVGQIEDNIKAQMAQASAQSSVVTEVKSEGEDAKSSK